MEIKRKDAEPRRGKLNPNFTTKDTKSTKKKSLFSSRLRDLRGRKVFSGNEQAVARRDADSAERKILPKMRSSSNLHCRDTKEKGKNGSQTNAHRLVTRIGSANFFFAPLHLCVKRPLPYCTDTANE
jgi:hypothetical protein